MSDRNAQGNPSDASDEYRPFNDPRHPSWYTDASEPVEEAAPPHPGREAAARNPYADQPLAGPYGNGQAQYPIHGGYPVVANEPGRDRRNPYEDGPGDPSVPGPGGSGHGPQGQYRHGGMHPVRPGGGSPPAAGRASSTGLGITAMVLGIVGLATFGFLLVPQILALVFGHLSLAREPRARGFAIAGLIMGYLVCGLWVLFILLGMASLAAFA